MQGLYKGMEAVGVTYYTKQAPHKWYRRKMSSKEQHPNKYEKIYIKTAQNRRYTSTIRRNQYARFELKGMKTIGFRDYTM